MSRPLKDNHDLFEGLAHPARRRIIEVIGKGEATPTDLQDHFDFSLPTLSHHLKILRETGLLTMRNRNNRRIYTVSKQGMKRITRWLTQHTPK